MACGVGCVGHGMPTDAEEDRRVSCCLVTGMTGSGKTSLVRSLLSSLPQDARCIVCIHQHAKSFGLDSQPPIPSDMLPSDPRLAHFCQVFDFGSGCICCSPDGDLTRELVERIPHMATAGYSHLIIESTGLADPRPFIRLLCVDPVIVSSFRLDRVVCVADAGRIEQQLAEPVPLNKLSKASVQVRNADTLLLNKLDKLQEEDRRLVLEQVKVAARRLNEGIRLMEAETGGRMGWSRLMEAERDRSQDKLPCGACDDDGYERLVQIVNLEGHDQTYQTACVQEEGGVIWSRAREWIDRVLLEGRVEEIKGFLSVSYEDLPEDVATYASSFEKPHLRTVSISAIKDDIKIELITSESKLPHSALADSVSVAESAARAGLASKLFFVGKGIDQYELEEGLRAAMAPQGFIA
ncbi:hypothetical protein GUITHDRAFT_141127, partial [Guillardia theta CCMP2712]